MTVEKAVGDDLQETLLCLEKAALQGKKYFVDVFNSLSSALLVWFQFQAKKPRTKRQPLQA